MSLLPPTISAAITTSEAAMIRGMTILDTTIITTQAETSRAMPL
jgi:hypothetical protein